MDMTQIREHMEVVGSDGQHVGTVDEVEGASIKLTKNDPQAGGEHHWISMDMIDDVQDTVRLRVSAAEALDQWLSQRPAETLPDNQVGGVAEMRDDTFAEDRQRAAGGEVY